MFYYIVFLLRTISYHLLFKYQVCTQSNWLMYGMAPNWFLIRPFLRLKLFWPGLHASHHIHTSNIFVTLSTLTLYIISIYSLPANVTYATQNTISSNSTQFYTQTSAGSQNTSDDNWMKGARILSLGDMKKLKVVCHQLEAVFLQLFTHQPPWLYSNFTFAGHLLCYSR
jgi:hypothetical protein